ncbi:zinc finger protein 395-like isoform X2 [Cololabis saira]|uniref:zinc finger protein 395-like isoform X2 n=1 Tax=Cololabis saira TaxID=129043 RepID=UPI002AD44CDA|nr:zinc finger protein 395-like isoform X2 [Cololabis saira]
MFPKPRLGKRSPFGALVSSTCPSAGTQAHLDTPGIAVATGAGQQGINRVKGHSNLKVYFQCGGAGEHPGVLGQPSSVQPDASSLWPSPRPFCPSSSSSRSVSSCIDVPRSSRSQKEVDMDELMAAMVLSSLSCSPPPQGPAHPDPAAPAMDCSGGELSDSGSSGYWSVGPAQRSSAPPSPEGQADADAATPPDEGLDMELDQVLFDEPAPRKRKNSVKVVYRCLWPSCAKVLTSVVGIKRHIRTTHLCHGGEHERCSRSEEDFYYTEVDQSQHHNPAPPPLCGPAPSYTNPTPSSPNSSPSSPPSPPPPSPPSPPPPACSALSSSAPSHSDSVWTVQSDHSYQAPPPSHSLMPAVLPSCRLPAPPTTCTRQGATCRVRSVSVGEQWLQQHSAPCRRIRSEAKKCRKVYGIEHRDQWCTPCRWKKACQRFLD